MRKILTYPILIIASLLIITAFVTATTYAQLIVAALFFPFYAYIALEIFPRKKRTTSNSPIVSQPQNPAQANTAKVEIEEPVEDKGVLDMDKRTFLKLIGAAGLTLFLSSIFYRKAQNTLLGGGGEPGSVALQDSEGNKINPVESQPTDGYRIAEIDDSIIAYYGFAGKNGSWYIMREDTENGSFRYAKGDSDLANNWVNRQGLSYDYYSNVF